MDAASSTGAAPEQDPRHSLSISFLSVAVLGTRDTMRDKTDVVLALLALVLVRHGNRTTDDTVNCECTVVMM